MRRVQPRLFAATAAVFILAGLSFWGLSMLRGSGSYSAPAQEAVSQFPTPLPPIEATPQAGVTPGCTDPPRPPGDALAALWANAGQLGLALLWRGSDLLLVSVDESRREVTVLSCRAPLIFAGFRGERSDIAYFQYVDTDKTKRSWEVELRTGKHRPAPADAEPPPGDVVSPLGFAARVKGLELVITDRGGRVVATTEVCGSPNAAAALCERNFSRLAWSRDGRYLAFPQSKNNETASTMVLDVTDLSSLPIEAAVGLADTFVWAPDRPMLCAVGGYSTTNGVVYDIARGRIDLVRQLATPGRWFMDQCYWAADGGLLASFYTVVLGVGPDAHRLIARFSPELRLLSGAEIQGQILAVVPSSGR